MRGWIALAVMAAGCSRGGGGTNAAARDGARDAAAGAAVIDAGGVSADAAVVAARWRRDVVVPIAVLGGRRFVPLAGWLEGDGPAPAPPEQHGPPVVIDATPNVTVQPRIVPADGVGPTWRAAVGAAVPAYDRAGARCASTIGALYWLGLENGDTSLGEEPYLVGELTTAAGCDPIVVTDRPEPRFAAPTKATPAQEAAATRAYHRLPEVRAVRRGDRAERELRVQRFAGADGDWMVVAAATVNTDDGCGSEPEVRRAVFALGGAAPRLVTVFEGEDGLGTVGLFDSDHDGHVELVTGQGRFDHGMTLHASYVAYLDAAPEPDAATAPAAGADVGPAASIDFSIYFGCD